MKDIIKYKDIKVGMLLVPDLDGFLLGNRWLVKEQREDGSFYCEHYHCGIRDPYPQNDWLIKPDYGYEYWYKVGETLEEWQKTKFYGRV